MSETQRLWEASVAPATWKAYQCGLNSFRNFRLKHNLPLLWPATTQHITLFIASLSLEGLSSSSISSYVSAIAFIHKTNCWSDPYDNFVIKKVLEGCRRTKPNTDDTRLPITSTVLHNIICKLPFVCSSTFETSLFKAALLLAFCGFLRVSEYAAHAKHGNTSRMLQVSDVHISGYGDVGMDVIIRHSKTDQKSRSVKLKISNLQEKTLCPVKAMREFLAVRPLGQGALFIHMDKLPLTYNQINTVIRKCTDLLGLPSMLYSSHSLRIGAATSAAANGISEDLIKEMGRWKSSSFQLYIRPENITNNPNLLFI